MHGKREFIGALLTRVKNILIRPRGDEWRVICDEPETYSGVIFRYVAILAAIPPAAASIDGVVFSRPAIKTFFFHLSAAFSCRMFWTASPSFMWSLRE